MKLTLKNIGILHNVEIDLGKDLIILCGPNNTGKTYATYTTYAINRYAIKGGVGSSRRNIDLDFGEDWIEKGFIDIDMWDIFIRNEKAYSQIFPREVNSLLYNVFDSSRDFFQYSELALEFNHEILKEKFLLKPYKSEIRFANFLINFSKNVNEIDLKISIITQNNLNEKEVQMPNRLLKTTILPDIINTLLLQMIFWDSYITPAERVAINLFSRQLSVQRNKIVEELLTYSEGKNSSKNILTKAKLYPLPIRDCLEISEQLVEYQKQESEFGYLANYFESEILNGKIHVSELGEVQYTPNNEIRNGVKSLGIHLSASMVKSLSSLVFYFRHIAHKGDFIIIDEPELNLHPDNQRKIAKLIARIVNAGFKVMISTHSDYIYRELNNQIMLNQNSDKAKELKGIYQYEQEELLDYQKVGAYLFLPNETQILTVTETGFEVKTIDDEIGKLNEASIEIFTSLF